MNVGKLLAHRWPHPCYLGASYLNCGWSWIHECQAYDSVGEEVCQRWWRFACAVGKVPYLERAAYVRTYAEELYPHLCQGWEVLPTATYGGRATLGLCWAP